MVQICLSTGPAISSNFVFLVILSCIAGHLDRSRHAKLCLGCDSAADVTVRNTVPQHRSCSTNGARASCALHDVHNALLLLFLQWVQAFAYFKHTKSVCDSTATLTRMPTVC